MNVIGNLTKDAIIRAAVSEGFTVSSAVGSGVVFETANTQGIAATYDTSNDKVVIVFRDSGANGQAVVGTVSGDSISFGTPVQFESGDVNNNSVVFDSSNNKVIISYVDTGNSDYGTSVVGTVSGTSISFGTPVVFASVGTSQVSSAFDTSANKVVVTYSQSGGKAIVGTVSGTSISFGSAVKFENGSTYNTATVYDTNANKTVIAYRDNGDGNKGKAVVGTVSGTSISYGSIVEFDTGNSRDMVMSYDPVAQKILLVYKILSSPNPGYSIVGTVSGTSISFGTRVEYHSGSTDVNRVVYDSNAQKHVILFRDQDTSPYRGKIIEATISGTSVSYGTEFEWSSTSFSEPAITYDPDQKKVVLAYVDANNSSYGTARVYTTGYTSATGGTIADGKAVIVNANGTVSTISQTSVSENLGSEVALPVTGNGSNNWAVHIGGTYDSVNGKVIITYNDYYQSQKGFALVGTVSGYTVTWGTPVEFEAGRTQWTSAGFDSVNGKVVISYQDMDNSFYGKSIVGTVSGNSISFGTPVVFQSSETTYTDTTYDVSAGAIVVSYLENTGSGGRVIAGTVSGTSISFGSAVQFGATGTYARAVYHPEEECTIIAWRDTSPTQGEARALTVSGTTISLGTAVAYQSGGQANQNDIAYDADSKKIVIVARDEVNATYGSSYVGTVSGTTLSFASPVTFQSGSVDWMGIEGWHTGGVALMYDNQGDGSTVQTFRFGTISGTTITWGSKTTLCSGGMGGYRGFGMDTANNRLVMVYNNNYVPQYRVYNPAYNSSNLTSENFVGFMDGAALDGTNGEILSSCSIARNQTSLTAGQTYFVSPADGSLSTSAGSPSVTAGTAISSTEIIVKG